MLKKGSWSRILCMIYAYLAVLHLLTAGFSFGKGALTMALAQSACFVASIAVLFLIYRGYKRSSGNTVPSSVIVAQCAYIAIAITAIIINIA